MTHSQQSAAIKICAAALLVRDRVDSGGRLDVVLEMLCTAVDENCVEVFGTALIPPPARRAQG